MKGGDITRADGSYDDYRANDGADGSISHISVADDPDTKKDEEVTAIGSDDPAPVFTVTLEDGSTWTFDMSQPYQNQVDTTYDYADVMGAPVVADAYGVV